MRGLPKAFRSLRVPAGLNVAAVGASLTTVTAAAFHALWRETFMWAAMSTFIVGTAWAAAIRVKPKRGGVRLGWVLSPAFACGNAMLCLAFMVFAEGKPPSLETIGGVMLAGALIGAFIWIPALVLTLVFFGIPIARAQKLAERGLAGADRGEIVVGLVSATLAAIGLAVKCSPIELGLAFLAITTGLAATALSVMRERARRAFVKRVEAGAVDQFRVEETAEGKVLVRVTTTGMAYRVSDFVEEIAQLSADGEVLATSRIAL